MACIRVSECVWGFIIAHSIFIEPMRTRRRDTQTKKTKTKISAKNIKYDEAPKFMLRKIPMY